jgi:hypothetical protein
MAVTVRKNSSHRGSERSAEGRQQGTLSNLSPEVLEQPTLAATDVKEVVFSPISPPASSPTQTPLRKVRPPPSV